MEDIGKAFRRVAKAEREKRTPKRPRFPVILTRVERKIKRTNAILPTRAASTERLRGAVETTWSGFNVFAGFSV
jgi:hypothetical protein